MKICQKCKQEQELEEFGNNKKCADGKNPICKKCRKKEYNKYRERSTEYSRKYRIEHNDWVKQKNKEFKERNPNYKKEYTENNKEKIKKYHAEFYEENKETIKQKVKEYRKNNPQYWEKQTKYKKQKYLKHLLYGLKHSDERQNREFNIKEDYIQNIVAKQNNTNLYTGTPIKWEAGHRGSSVDRIDSNIGHVLGNCQVVELAINRLKSDFTTKEFDRLIRKIRNVNIRLFVQRQYSSLSKIEKKKIWNLKHNTINRAKKINKNPTDAMTINEEFIINMYNNQNGLCAITGIPMNFYPDNIASVSIDRIDSDDDYRQGNIQLVIWPVNNMKSDMTNQDAVEIIRDIRKNKEEIIYDLEDIYMYKN